MSRNAVNFLLDFTLLVLFVVLLTISSVLQFNFPAATRAAGWRLWGLDYDAWALVRFVVLATLALGILVHLILHWTWACGFITSRVSRRIGRPIRTNEATRTVYGVAFLLLILCVMGATLLAAEFSVAPPASAPAMPPGLQRRTVPPDDAG